MRRALLHPRLFALLLTTLPALHAHAIYRCEIEGRIQYTDLPCEGGRQLDIALAPPSEEARARAAREKEELARLEKEAVRKAQAESKERRRRERELAALQRRCEKLQSRVKWTAEEARTASGNSMENAARKAERAAEQYRAECAKLEKPAGLIGISSR